MPIATVTYSEACHPLLQRVHVVGGRDLGNYTLSAHKVGSDYLQQGFHPGSAGFPRSRDCRYISTIVNKDHPLLLRSGEEGGILI